MVVASGKDGKVLKIDEKVRNANSYLGICPFLNLGAHLGEEKLQTD